MDFTPFLFEIQLCGARGIVGDAIYGLELIKNFDYLLQGLPSVVVHMKYAFNFFYCFLGEYLRINTMQYNYFVQKIRYQPTWLVFRMHVKFLRGKNHGEKQLFCLALPVSLCPSSPLITFDGKGQKNSSYVKSPAYMDMIH